MIFQKQGFFPRDNLFLSLSRGTETSYVPDAVQNILLLFFKIVIYGRNFMKNNFLNDFFKMSYIQCQKNFIYGKEDNTGNNFRRWCADTNTIKTEKRKI